MNNIEKFRQENLLSTEEIVVQFWSCSADCDELFEEWKKTPFDPNREEWNGIEMQLCYADNALLTLVLARQHKISQLVNDYHQGKLTDLGGFLYTGGSHSRIPSVHFITYAFKNGYSRTMILDYRALQMRKPLILG